MRATTGASCFGTYSRRISTPAAQTMPAVSIQSFTVNGTPCNAPERFAARNRGIRGARLGERGLRELNNRVEARIHGLDALQMGGDHLDRGHLLRTNRTGQGQRRKFGQIHQSRSEMCRAASADVRTGITSNRARSRQFSIQRSINVRSSVRIN